AGGPGEYGGRGQRGRRRGACADDGLGDFLQLGEGGRDPARVGRLEVHVARHQIEDTVAAERREALVEVLAHLAELRVGAVAKAEHGEVEPVELWRAVAHDLVVEVLRARRRIAL